MAELPDGGFVLGGETSDAGFVRQGTYVVRTDSVGTQLWHQRFGDPQLLNGFAYVQPTRDGNIAMVGSLGKALVNGTSYWRHCVYKLTPAGTLLWRREIGPISHNTDVHKLLELPDGRLVVGGMDGGPLGASVISRAAIYQLCPDGDSLWYRTYRLLTGPGSHNYLRGLAATPDGGFVGAGFVFPRPPDTGTNDGWVFKVDSAGYLQAGGAPVGVRCAPVGLEEPDVEEAQGLAVWPNPATGWLRVRVPGGGAVELRDALGRVVRTGTAARGEVEVRWSLHDVPAGVYLVRAGEQSRRVLVVP